MAPLLLTLALLAPPSTCPLPPAGANFTAYTPLGWMLLRTWVDCAVGEVVVEAYTALARSHPDRVWIYGETGWPAGGRFWPHRTHRDRRSVDFMTPLRGADGPRPLPLGLGDGFGYGVELDRRGRLGDAAIDAAAVGDHLLALDAAARARGGRIAKVILAPELQRMVKAARPATKRLPFTGKRVWVRHDDHYHVDFELPGR